ncbi:MAG: class I SAM-dependent methyltransferase [Cyclobacteriaceae bacterium]|nr:class I SAM-dependent methyltransferase [Cyclobacteriaceae bacterium]
MLYRELNRLLGNVDIYLLDAILKGLFEPEMKILDAGCGEGRNLFYFIRNGFSVNGIDSNASAIQMLQFTARSLNPNYIPSDFKVGKLEEMPWPDQTFDAIICSAVLHFAENEVHFFKMTDELVRVLKPGGTLFIRMASDIGFEIKPEKADDFRHHLPDGSVRFLLTRNLLSNCLQRYALSFIEPLKTVNVADQRCMSTLLLRLQ